MKSLNLTNVYHDDLKISFNILIIKCKYSEANFYPVALHKQLYKLYHFFPNIRKNYYYLINLGQIENSMDIFDQNL